MGSHYLGLRVPKDLTAGTGKAAQMSAGEDLARGEGEGGGLYGNMEARSCYDNSSG